MEIVEIQPGVLQLPPGVPLEFDRPVRSITLVQTRNVSEAGSRPVANAVVEVEYGEFDAEEAANRLADLGWNCAPPEPQKPSGGSTQASEPPAEAQSDAAGDRT